MRLTESPAQVGNTIERIRELMYTERTPGAHVSDLVLCLRKSRARKDGLVPSFSPSDLLVFAVGHAIQDYITGRAPETPLYKDGISGNCDWVDEDGTPWEVKATYASAARNVADNQHYFDQLGSYCYMLGKTKAYLAVFYLNGYYDFQRKKPREGAVPGERAVLKVYEVEWEWAELEALWEELQFRAELMSTARHWEELPIQYHYTWECDYCPLFKTGECEGGEGKYDRPKGLPKGNR